MFDFHLQTVGYVKNTTTKKYEYVMSLMRFMGFLRIMVINIIVGTATNL